MQKKLLIGLLVSLLLSLATGTSAQTLEVYAVAQQPEPGLIELRFISGTGNGTPATPQRIRVAERWYLTEAEGSSASPVVALAFRTGANYTVTTYDVSTQQMNIVHADVIISTPDFGLMAPAQYMVFSPNGRYLAYNVIEDMSTFQQNTYIYDTLTGQRLRLTSENAMASQIAWSENNDRLGVIVTTCSTNCAATLNVYSVGQWILEKSITLSTMVPEAATLSNSGVCQLRWSPNGDYVSLMANCDYSYYAYNKEIYVIDVQRGSLSRVTDFTYTQERIAPLYAVLAEYSTAWLDGQNLLISSHYGSGDGSRVTLAYNVETQQSITLSTSFSPSLLVNPMTSQLAIQSDISESFDTVDRQSPLSIADVSIQNGSQLSISEVASRIPAVGCNPQWSSDGSYIATTRHRNGYCLGHVSAVNITRVNEGDYRTTEITLDPSLPSIAVGWVRLV
jgi:hypothetical protein